MKLYELSHIRFIEPKNVTDKKWIGVFLSREKTDSVVVSLQKEPWFTDFPDGFVVDEFEIDFLYSAMFGFDPSKWMFFPTQKKKEELWVLQFSRPYLQDDWYDEIRTLGYFSSRGKAEDVMDQLKTKQGFNSVPADFYDDYPNGFYIGMAKVDFIGWGQGFVTL